MKFSKIVIHPNVCSVFQSRSILKRIVFPTHDLTFCWLIMKWTKLQREIKISYCPSKNSKLNPEPNINVVENRKQKQVDVELNIRKTENKVSAYFGYFTTDHINCALCFGTQ